MASRNLIYGLIDPRNGELRYVGKSTSGLRRPKEHTTPSILKRDRTHKANWIRGLLTVGLKPEIEVLEELDNPEDLVEAEQFQIAYYRAVGSRLTNLTDGGEGALGIKRSRKSMEGARGARSREVVDDLGTRYSSLNEAAHAVGVTAGSVWRVLVGRCRTTKGRSFKYADESREETKERATALAQMDCRKTEKYTPIVDQNGVVYPSQCEAARALGLRQSSIANVLSGRYRTTEGYVFRYVEDC